MSTKLNLKPSKCQIQNQMGRTKRGIDTISTRGLTFPGLTPTFEQTQKSFRGKSWTCSCAPPACPLRQMSVSDLTFKTEHHPYLTLDSLPKSTARSFCGCPNFQHSSLFQEIKYCIICHQSAMESLILENHISWRIT